MRKLIVAFNSLDGFLDEMFSLSNTQPEFDKSTCIDVLKKTSRFFKPIEFDGFKSVGYIVCKYSHQISQIESDG